MGPPDQLELDQGLPCAWTSIFGLNTRKYFEIYVLYGFSYLLMLEYIMKFVVINSNLL
jgi:hypothetical protein